MFFTAPTQDCRRVVARVRLSDGGGARPGPRSVGEWRPGARISGQ